MKCFHVSITQVVRATVLRQMDMGSLTCAHIVGACFFLSCLRSNAGVVMSDLEVDALEEMGSGLEFLLGSPQLVPEVSPRGPQACSFPGWGLDSSVHNVCI